MYESSVKILQTKLDENTFGLIIEKYDHNDKFMIWQINDNKVIKRGNIDEVGSFIDGLVYGKKYYSQR